MKELYKRWKMYNEIQLAKKKMDITIKNLKSSSLLYNNKWNQINLEIYLSNYDK